MNSAAAEEVSKKNLSLPRFVLHEGLAVVSGFWVTPIGVRRIAALSARQHFECTPPVVFEKSRNAPQHAQWFDGSCRCHASAVIGFPTKLFDDCGHLNLGVVVIAAQKHGGDTPEKWGFTIRPLPTLLKAFMTRAAGILA
jgi:hypothetical protein